MKRGSAVFQRTFALVVVATTSLLSCRQISVNEATNPAGGSGTTSTPGSPESSPNPVAAPSSAPAVTSTSIIGGNISVSGRNFGLRPSAAPRYFSTFDGEPVGQMPARQITNLLPEHVGTVQQNRAHSGAQSLEFDYCTDYGLGNFATGVVVFPGSVVLYNNRFYEVTNNAPLGGLTCSSAAGNTPDENPTYFKPISARDIPPEYCAKGFTKEHWLRNAIDLGTTPSPKKVYFSAWVYMDKATSTSNIWQWKGPLVTSSSLLYYDISDTMPGKCQNAQAWERTDVHTSCWWNEAKGNFNSAGGGAGYAYIYDDRTLAGDLNTPDPAIPTSCKTMHGASPAPARADGYQWGQWQRLEWYAERASGPGVNDGKWSEGRIGYAGNAKNFSIPQLVTHIGNNADWRYVVLTNAVASVVQGYVDFKLYFDDLYVDTTPARVELCDSPTWALRTHCEIQPTIAWAEDHIAASYNPGTFASGTQAYAYVIDDQDKVSNGSPVIVSGGYVAPAPQLSWTITPVTVSDFGKVLTNSKSTRLFLLKNAGTVPARPADFSVPAPYSISSNGCAVTLNPADTCRIEVTFQPVVPGTFDANLANGASSQSLSGSAVTPESYIPYFSAFDSVTACTAATALTACALPTPWTSARGSLAISSSGSLLHTQNDTTASYLTKTDLPPTTNLLAQFDFKLSNLLVGGYLQIARLSGAASGAFVLQLKSNGSGIFRGMSLVYYNGANQPVTVDSQPYYLDIDKTYTIALQASLSSSRTGVADGSAAVYIGETGGSRRLILSLPAINTFVTAADGLSALMLGGIYISTSKTNYYEFSNVRLSR